MLILFKLFNNLFNSFNKKLTTLVLSLKIRTFWKIFGKACDSIAKNAEIEKDAEMPIQTLSSSTFNEI